MPTYGPPEFREHRTYNQVEGRWESYISIHWPDGMSDGRFFDMASAHRYARNAHDDDMHTAADIARELGITTSRVYAIAKTRRLGKRFGDRTIYFNRTDTDAMRERAPGRPRKD